MDVEIAEASMKMTVLMMGKSLSPRAMNLTTVIIRSVGHSPSMIVIIVYSTTH